MKKLLLPLCFIAVFILGIFVVKAGKPPVVVAPVKDTKAEKRKVDSLLYVNFKVDSKDYTFQDTPNEVLLPNGMKIKIVKLHRFAIPRGVSVNIPDDISLRSTYELAEIEIVATNTNSVDVKLGPGASETLFNGLKFFSAETGSKAFISQYPLSFGSIYPMMEPAQTEKLTPVFKETNAMISEVYKPGQSKTSKGIILCLPKAAKQVDKLIVTTQEFGVNKFYACPLNL